MIMDAWRLEAVGWRIVRSASASRPIDIIFLSRVVAPANEPSLKCSRAWKGGGDQLWDNYNNNDDETRTIAFNNKPSKEGRDMDKAIEMFEISSKIVGYTSS